MQWRMNVATELGFSRGYITSDDAIASLDSFSLDRAGNCLEASFTALPSEVTIQPRDIITLQVWWLGSWWAPFWRGVIVQAGNPRSHDVQPYRAVGLKQRFYEVLLRESVIDGADVASMAFEVATLACARVRGASMPASFATTGFELSDRHPGLETMGDCLDALAASVGSFEVATGDSYTYDGITYNAGDTVPAVTWGVDGTGKVFFKRPQAIPLALDEASVGTRVTWTETNAEGYVNSVTLTYLTEVQSERLIGWRRIGQTLGQTEPLIVAPLSRAFTSAGTTEESSAIVTLPYPLDYMGKMTPGYTVNYGSIPTAAYAVDGDLDTKAYLASGSSITFTAGARGPCLWRVRMAWYAGFDITLYVTLLGAAEGGGTATSTLAYVIKGADRESDGNPIDLWLPSLPLAGVKFANVSTATSGVQIIAEQNVSSGAPEVYEVEYYLPDCDTFVPGSASQPLAESFLRPVPANVATVEVFGMDAYAGVKQTIDLTTAADEELELSVERIEFSITAAEGAIVRYHIGQPFASEMESQRVVLERLARRATAGALS